jgi:O-antigen/teichoic acid export membrane protein
MVDLAISLVEGLILLAAWVTLVLQVLGRAIEDGLGAGLGAALVEALTWLAVVGAIVVTALLALGWWIVWRLRRPRAAT